MVLLVLRCVVAWLFDSLFQGCVSIRNNAIKSSSSSHVPSPAPVSLSLSLPPHTDTTPRHLPGRGRGVVAVDDIPVGTQLFYIPQGKMLTSGTSSFAGSLASVAPGTKLAEKLGVELSPYYALILAAAYEAAAAERGESPWTPWLRAVPFDGSVDPPLVWEDRELLMLHGTIIPRWVAMEREEVAANWYALLRN